MRAAAPSGPWLAALVALLAAVALTGSLAVTHRAAVAEQRQRAAMGALQDFGALLSKMGAPAGSAATDAAYLEAWLAVFQGRPGQAAGLEAACRGETPGAGLRWIRVAGAPPAGHAALGEAAAEPLPRLGPNVVRLALPAGSLCPRAVEVVAVRDRVGAAEVIVGRMVDRPGRAWGLAALGVAGMGALLLAIGVASAAWARHRLLAAVRRVNATLERAAVGDFDHPVPEADVAGELRLLAQQVNRTLERLKELLVWLRDTSDQLAHDFRTPLARAQARLERFAGAGDPALVAEAARDLAALTARMNDALSLRDGEAWAFETVRLDAICAAAADLYQPLAEAREVRIETDLAPAAALGVESLLQRAVANLVDNAIKYSPDGGTVRVRAGSGDGRAVVSVTDEGPGLEATAAAESRPGDSHRMGLGFVRAIVRRHGGQLEIDSGPGGSTVTIRI